MYDYVRNDITTLFGSKSLINWIGYNTPSEIERQSNLWVTKAGTRIFTKGFYDLEISQSHVGWGMLVEGEMLLECGDRKLKFQKGMFYLIPDSLKVTARNVDGPFLVWIEFTGSLSKLVFETVGGWKNDLITGQCTNEQIKIALNIVYLLQNHPPHYNLSVQSMLWRLISEHSDTYSSLNRISDTVKRAVDYIRRLPADEKVTLSQLAEVSMLPVETFRKKFHSEVGEAPIKYLLRCRIGKAKEQLLDSSKSIEQISYESGFLDPYYFSRVFKQFEGISPLYFRKKMNAHLKITYPLFL